MPFGGMFKRGKLMPLGPPLLACCGGSPRSSTELALWPEEGGRELPMEEVEAAC